ncbi:hypothetical protein U9M48_005419 [Paspalum notatum var. saurae]|uniref:Reverse transcriptase domain-containing protein n=1 Tax=Paspalum notatum var. saurae TaxID=547442 RepID=A0AAQ3PS76_PASNO
MRLNLNSMSKYHIDMDVEEANGSVWRFTGFYGEPRTDQRDRAWDTLRGLNVTPVKPWLCAGDFNEILVNEEKVGGVTRAQGGETDFHEVLDVVQRRVTQEMNEELMKPFTEKEIVAVLDNIGDMKAPGPDGMPALFYKEYWQIVGGKVVQEVLGVLRGGEMPDEWNCTNITLIPKVNKPENIKDLRPISLCNVIYKLVAKVLANRMRGMMADVISMNQSAFVPGRLISDNILIAYEMTHYLRTKKKGDRGYAAIKLDMSKAYDRVEWDFLKGMMQKLGFGEQWISNIMKCVTTVKYRVRVNGNLSEEFVPERGLRQGDPLSPYLFLICAQGFSELLRDAEEKGHIRGGDAQHLQRVLQMYEACSGQMINKEKSAIMFSPNTSNQARREVMQVMQVRRDTMNDKYLGLPISVGRERAKTFMYLKNRIWQRIKGWKEKMLSKTGKEVLIKTVAQAIPTFAMGCFDITKGVCDQISKMLCRYWWSCQENEKKIHWIRWETLCKPKSVGLDEERERLCRGHSAAELVSDILHMEEKKRLMIITLMWNWWNERNRRREGEKERSASELAFITASLVHEFGLINETARSGEVSDRPRAQRWSPPEGEVIKVNTDGSYCPRTKNGGWGFVLRDTDGEVVSAGAGRLTQALDPFHVEVMACLIGVTEEAEKGVGKVVIETDSMMVVEAVKSRDYTLSAMGGLIYEIKGCPDRGVAREEQERTGTSSPTSLIRLSLASGLEYSVSRDRRDDWEFEYSGFDDGPDNWGSDRYRFIW